MVPHMKCFKADAKSNIKTYDMNITFTYYSMN